uniref:Uncharacterized protein n=1 Tax=Anguilla anguilla TaxID=7936 RepID=A0A0E9QDW9_ANGAN
MPLPHPESTDNSSLFPHPGSTGSLQPCPSL